MTTPALAAYTTWPVWDRDGEVCGSLVFVDDGERRDIVRADPRVIATDAFVYHLERGRVDRVKFDRWRLGALVQFVGDNRTVTYRIIDCHLNQGLWLLQWPD